MAKIKTVTTTEAEPDPTLGVSDVPDLPDSIDGVATTPVKIVHIHKAKDSVLWQRLVLSVLGIGIVVGMWRWATFHLYTLPEHSITSFTSITNNTLYTIASLVLFFVTGKIFFDWKNQTASTVVESAQHTFDTIKQDVNSNSNSNSTGNFKNTNINLTGNVVQEGQDGAPTVKPFSQPATTK